MKQLLCIIILFSVLFTLKAQVNEPGNDIIRVIDSLKQELADAPGDTNKVLSQIALSRKLYGLSDFESAVQYASEALSLSDTLAFKKGQATSHNTLGLIHRDLGNYSISLQHHLSALKIREEMGDKKGIGNAYNNIGIIYDDFGNYSEALRNYFAALKIREAIGDKKGIAYSFDNIGVTYNHQGNYEEARKSSLHALKIVEEIGDKDGISRALTNIGNTYYYQDRYPDALKYYFQALTIDQELGNKYGVASTYNNIGTVYGEQGDYAAALENLQTCLKIQEEIGNKQGIAVACNAIGNTYLKLKDYARAIEYFNKALSVAKEIGSRNNSKESYRALADTYAGMKDFKQAYYFHQLYSDLKDSLLNQESTIQSAQMKAQYESEKKDAEIVLLQKDNQLKVQEARQQRILRNVLIAGFALALLSIFLFINRYRIKQRMNNILTEKNKIITAQKEKVEQQAFTLKEALTELKKRQEQLVQAEKMASVGILTAGLAHEINNPINFVSGNIQPLKRNFTEQKNLLSAYEQLLLQAGKKEELEKLRKEFSVDENLSESEDLFRGIEEGARRTTEIVKGLRNFSRTDDEAMKWANINEGLESTIMLLRNKLKQQQIEIEMSLGDIPAIESYPGQLNQVFMNLVTNAIDAIGEQQVTSEKDRKISISTSLDNSFVKISVRDTGSGMNEDVKKKLFDPFFTTKEVGKGTGLGLSISYGIIEKHQGKIDVRSEAGKGTEIIVTLPVEQMK